jgi:hypothetical protein
VNWETPVVTTAGGSMKRKNRFIIHGYVELHLSFPCATPFFFVTLCTHPHTHTQTSTYTNTHTNTSLTNRARAHTHTDVTIDTTDVHSLITEYPSPPPCEVKIRRYSPKRHATFRTYVAAGTRWDDLVQVASPCRWISIFLMDRCIATSERDLAQGLCSGVSICTVVLVYLLCVGKASMVCKLMALPLSHLWREASASDLTRQMSTRSVSS